ncbi:MAG: aldo/keto reductase [Marinilabiliaceae bacterium]|nr:aldo/keto reductase [Marinilabiliaceae bacterium]
MNRQNQNSRREFLKKMAAAAALTTVASPLSLLSGCSSTGSVARMPLRPLGRTGHMVGIYSLGAQATVETPGKEELAVQIVNKAIDLGINYIDTAAAYGRATENIPRADAMGTSERNVGQVMKTRRNEVFLASKTHDRTYDGSMRLLEKSLKNLQTDHLDLWQVHNVKAREKDIIDTFFAEGGVIKAMEKARSEGIVKNIGFTGHEDPEVLKMMAERYDFDNVLVAINAADKHYNSFIDKFLPVVVEQGIGIVGMKIPARDRIFDHGGIISMKEAMDYVMTLPVSTIIIGIDEIAELEENIKIAREFKPLSADELLAIEDKALPHYEHLQFFKDGIGEWPAEW